MGIILLPVGALVIGLYLWMGARSVRWIFANSHSIWAGIGVATFLVLLPIGDTIVNRWYHKNVLCARDDVGLHVIERVILPNGYYDNKGRFKEPNGWFSGNAILEGRYQRRSGYMDGGTYPFTAHEKRYAGVFDLREQKFISHEVDYWTKGGGWWLAIFRPLFPQQDYLTYVRGLVDGVNCSAARYAIDARYSSINAAFEQKRGEGE